MNILAIETSSTFCSVAIGNLDTTIANLYNAHFMAPMKQSQVLLPTIEAGLAAARLTLKDINLIAYGAGPGSFTGIRLATSTAQALAYALEIPLIDVSSLAALAQGAKVMDQTEVIAVCLNASQGKVYWAEYQRTTNRVALITPERLVAIDTLKNKIRLSAKHWIALGNGWQTISNLLEHISPELPEHIDTNCHATAKAVLTLSRAKIAANCMIEPKNALPNYLQEPLT